MTEGFLLIDKPPGCTSHDVVEHVRRLVGQRKVGHGGTLDPPATGLLVLALGRCTRLLRFVQAFPKWYETTILFGVATDTLDASGAVLSREPMPFSEHELRRVVERFHGTILQVPPMVSALRVDGRRLYDLARAGQEVDRPARPAEVYEIIVDDFSPGEYPEATMRIRCGKGTYIRTLADDIAQALGGRAHVASLRRTAVGSLQVKEAAAISDLDSGGWSGHLLSAAQGLRDIPALLLSPEQAAAVGHGMPIVAEGRSAERCRLLDADERLLAVYRRSGRHLVPEVVLV